MEEDGYTRVLQRKGIVMIMNLCYMFMRFESAFASLQLALVSEGRTFFDNGFVTFLL